MAVAPVPAGPPIHPAYVRNLLAGPIASGRAVGPLLASVGLPASLEALPREGTTPPVFVRLSRRVAAALDDETSGLLDRPQRIGTLEIMAAHASHAPTLLEAYRRFLRFQNVLDAGLRHGLEQSGEEVAHVVRRIPGRRILNELALETALVVLHRFIGWLGGVRIPVNRADLDYRAPGHAYTYRWLFPRAPVRFGAPTNRLAMPRQVLERPVRRTEAQAIQWARRSPLDTFLPLQGTEGTALRVASVVEKALMDSGRAPSMEEVAKRLRVSARTLRERLRAEGDDYRRIRSLAKRDAATRLLTTTDRSVEQVAFGMRLRFGQRVRAGLPGVDGMTPRAYRVAAAIDAVRNAPPQR
jgi:AraC-like DNA-binding protein